jgi:rubrerythrin
LAETGTNLLRRYLDEAIAAASGFEAQLRKFAAEGDDEDVQAAFAAHADEARYQAERLARRLQQMGGSVSGSEHASAKDIVPPIPQTGRREEERTLQHLIATFGEESSESAFYEVLAAVAAASRDAETESLARQIQAEEQRAAKKFFSFIRSRSKIAFNMLTPNELDPAVETKAFDNPVV